MIKGSQTGMKGSPSAAVQEYWMKFECEFDSMPQTSIVHIGIDPETYAEYYVHVTDQLFKTPPKEGIGFLERYIERIGSVRGIGSALLKHSYFEQDIAKSHPHDPDRIEEALVQLRDTRREKGALTLDDVVATSYLLADEFDRQATFLLAYELGYLEPQALGVSAQGKNVLIQRSPSRTEGQAYIAEILQWMDLAASKNMPLSKLLPKIHFFLHDGPRLYATAVSDIKEKKYDVAERKLTGLRSAADMNFSNIDGAIVYQLAQIALKTNNPSLAEQRLREAVMLPCTAFPEQYGVKQENVYTALDCILDRQLSFHTQEHGSTFCSIVDLYITAKKYEHASKHLEHGIRAIDAQQRRRSFDTRIIKKSDLYFLLATCYQKLSRKDVNYIPKCVEAASRARKCSPHNTEISSYCDTLKEIYETKGKKMFDSDRYNEAMPYLTAARTLGASGEWLTWRIARCYEAAGYYADARVAYESQPHFKNAKLGLARIRKSNNYLHK